MTTRSILRATLMAIAAVLVVASGVLADTCCANLSVGLNPRFSNPGDIVRITGLQCRSYDNTGSLPLNLGAFWLSSGRRPADPDPGSVPGLGLPAPDLPPVGDWFAFRTVPNPAATIGDATITVPGLPKGTYQLWWWCDDGSGPGGGIHYSTGPRLAIGAAPDTATATEVAGPPGTSGTSGFPIGLVIAFGTAVFFGLMRWGPFGPRAKTSAGSTHGRFQARARGTEPEEQGT